MTEITKNKNIAFYCNDLGELPVGIGKTGFSGLLTLGALIRTGRFFCDEVGAYKQFMTDVEGIKRASFLAEQALDVIEDTIQTIGYLMAYVDQKEVSDSIYKAGWVLVALSELANQIRLESGFFNHPRAAMPTHERASAEAAQ